MLKRQMYGRANPDLLRLRVLLADLTETVPSPNFDPWRLETDRHTGVSIHPPPTMRARRMSESSWFSNLKSAARWGRSRLIAESQLS